MEKREIRVTVKDEELVKKRRNQIIKGAVNLFKEKGFHRTTTREIARAAGFSIGTLYEYIQRKEDVLYLVCDYIYDEVYERFQKEREDDLSPLENLKKGIISYFRVVDGLQDEFLVMYQETKSLSKDALPYVLKKEMEMTAILEDSIRQCVESGELHLSEEQIKLFSHNIIVQGQMWAFRRWSLQKMFTFEEYIDRQIGYIFSGIQDKEDGEREKGESFRKADKRMGVMPD